MQTAGNSEFLEAIGWLASAGFELNARAFREVHASSLEGRLAFTVLVLAALSRAAGQSVILFLHAVPPLRFAVSILMTAVLLVGSVFLWTGVFDAAAWLLFGLERRFMELFIAVSLGHAPLVFGFLGLIPWLGLVIRRLLHIWTLLAVTLSLAVVVELPFWQILTAALLGWLLVEILYRVAGRPIQWTNDAIEILLHGKRENLSVRTLREALLRSMDRV